MRTKLEPGVKQIATEKVSRIPIKVIPTDELPKKPEWIKIKIPTGNKVQEVKKLLRKHGLHSVCEEASCPNLGECFSGGTATFMVMGDICTRRCPFCDVAHGRPLPLNENEPINLAVAIADMNLKYVVITSVDRDDLLDGGASHFSACITEIRKHIAHITVEILVPDYRGRMEKALNAHIEALPDIFNHNLETVPRLYKAVRPGADYQWSLTLLKEFKKYAPHIPTKSGLMVGIGETDEEILQVMLDLRKHNVEMLTIGQYLQPTRSHLRVERFVHPDTFKMFEKEGKNMGFTSIASGALVRSSYHAEQQALNYKH